MRRRRSALRDATALRPASPGGRQRSSGARGGRRRVCSATRRASGSSFASPSSANPIENVCTGRVDRSAISVAMRLESSPPESMTPSGTSDTMPGVNRLAEQLEQVLLVLLPAGGRRGFALPRRPVLAQVGNPAVVPHEQSSPVEASAPLRTASAARARTRARGRAPQQAGRAAGETSPPAIRAFTSEPKASPEGVSA